MNRFSDELTQTVVGQLEGFLGSYTDSAQRLTLLRAVLSAEDGPARVATFLRSMINEGSIDALSPLLGPLSPDLGDELTPLLEEIYSFAGGTPGYRIRGIQPVLSVISTGDVSTAAWLADRWEKLLEGQRAAFRRKLVELLDRNPQNVSVIGPIVLRVRLRAADRESIVRAFLRASARENTDAALRSEALDIAKKLASRSKPLTKLVADATA
jgi:hypothetical protein